MSRRHPSVAAVRGALADQPELSMFCTYQQPDLIELFGAERMVRLPIAENAMLGMAVGMALLGRRVLVSIARAAFLFSAFDQLINEATKWRYMSDGQFTVPIVIRGLTQGGEHLGAQHEHAAHGMLSQIPGLVVAVPGSPNAAAGLLRTALVHPDPVVVLESPRLYGPDWAELPEPEPNADPLPFGVAGQARPGGGLTLVGIGNTVATCLRAAATLDRDGLRVQVVDLRTAAPLDLDGVAGLVDGAGPVVLVDEAPAGASVMSALGLHLVRAGVVAPDRLDVLAGAPVPAPVSPPLVAALLPDERRVVTAARALLDRHRPGRVAAGAGAGTAPATVNPATEEPR
ncbi:transketolase C-terminal domain-containing protein [Solwaraspora sp. WMMD406]|uniref:transketolase C-terminal domain-containing protein n=1 Tax=Solwaraspora sp. WMMD406 TaxID=3016095 RepID=UPI002415C99D|nr:transketolase C-terminal domain-containing protein [Solwaraspora sp. WMMD406]MDG4765944.1 transketolase C-terminal domain-containing protein [Solwaraspora sp. WMMD406]